MSSINKATVKLSLEDKDDVDYLVADMADCGVSKLYEINLNDESTCQANLKELFLAIAKGMTNYEISISYTPPEDYPRQFISDAMNAYIEDLKAEIRNVDAAIKRELE